MMPVQVFHEDRGRRPFRHGNVSVQHRVEVKAAALRFARLLFDGVHDVRALPFAAREHSIGDGAGELREDRLQAAHHRLETGRYGCVAPR